MVRCCPADLTRDSDLNVDYILVLFCFVLFCFVLLRWTATRFAHPRTWRWEHPRMVGDNKLARRGRGPLHEGDPAVDIGNWGPKKENIQRLRDLSINYFWLKPAFMASQSWHTSLTRIHNQFISIGALRSCGPNKQMKINNICAP